MVSFELVALVFPILLKHLEIHCSTMSGSLTPYVSLIFGEHSGGVPSFGIDGLTADHSQFLRGKNVIEGAMNMLRKADRHLWTEVEKADIHGVENIIEVNSDDEEIQQLVNEIRFWNFNSNFLCSVRAANEFHGKYDSATVELTSDGVTTTIESDDPSMVPRVSEYTKNLQDNIAINIRLMSA